MASMLQTVVQIVAPKKLGNPKGIAESTTFNSTSANNALTAPQYQEHLSDIFDTRLASDSRDLIKQLLIQDPDASAALNSFLTLSDTQPIILVKDVNGKIDRAGLKTVNALIDTDRKSVV